MRSVKQGLLATAAAVALTVGLSGAANAAWIDFYNGSDATAVGSGQRAHVTNSETFTQGGFVLSATSNGTSMTIAHEGGASPNELGLGVCSSSGGSTCALMPIPQVTTFSGWTGEQDEIDNSVSGTETLTISEGAGTQLNGQFRLSSLDTGGSPVEHGYITFSAGTIVFEKTSDAGNVFSIIGNTTGLTATIAQAGAGFGGNVALLSIAGFPLGDTSVTFGAGCDGVNVGFTCGTNNDYLVASAGVVPIPAALPLMLSALGGLGLIARRRKSEAA